MKAYRFEQKVALVTGAGRGIGRAIALRLAAEGAFVWVNDLPASADSAVQTVALIHAAGGQSGTLLADVTDREGLGAAIRDARLARARIDALVNNAGRAVLHDALTMSARDLDDALGTNLHGVINTTQLLAPVMQAQRYGKIVNIASIAAYGTAVRSTTPYAIAKAGVAMYTKRAAMELGPYQVNVNCVCPGGVETEMLQVASSADPQFEALRRDPAAVTMLGRLATLDEIAAAVAFLASDDAAFITAQVLAVDGGRLDFLTHSA